MIGLYAGTNSYAPTHGAKRTGVLLAGVRLPSTIACRGAWAALHTTHRHW